MPPASRILLLLLPVLAGCAGTPDVPEPPAEAAYRPDPADLSVTVEEAGSVLQETMGRILDRDQVSDIKVSQEHLTWTWFPRNRFTSDGGVRGRFVSTRVGEGYASMDPTVWTRDRSVHWVDSAVTVDEYTGGWVKAGELEAMPHVWRYRWASLEDARRFADAVAASGTLRSGNAFTFLSRGRRRYADGRIDEARADVQRWLDRHPRRRPVVEGRDPVLLCDLAWLHDQADEGMRHLQAAEERDDPSAILDACRRLWAVVSSEHAGTDEPAILERAGRALSRLPQPPPLPEEARRLFIQAKAHIEARAFDRAVPPLEELREIHPWLPEAHFNRAEVLAELKRFPEAIAAMKDFLRLAPLSPDARAAQDRIYAWEAAQAR